MNTLKATLTSIQTAGEITLLGATYRIHVLSAMVLDLPPMLALGDEVELLFKENEVMLATIDSKVSARNAFVSRVVSIILGELLAQIELDFEGTIITAIITKESCRQLLLKEDETIMWFIKANEVSLRI